jgi:Protein of unknown function (DUF4238)
VKKRHHFNPVLHLQHFAGAEPKGQVWTYDKTTGDMRSAIPEQTAVETNFYSVERDDGSMDTTIEDYLADVEGKAAPVYDGLLQGTTPTGQPRADFAQFLALMYVRTPAMRRMAGNVVGREIQIMNYAYASNPKAFDALLHRVEKAGGPKLTEDLKKARRPS